MLAARDRKLMKGHRIGRRLEIVGWATVAVVTAACIAFIAQTVTGSGG
jgi:Mn2+/Fe2+ NRAMP family transporter